MPWLWTGRCRRPSVETAHGKTRSRGVSVECRMIHGEKEWALFPFGVRDGPLRRVVL